MREPLRRHIQLLLSEKLHRKIIIISHQPVFSGDISTSFFIDTNNGKWFIKVNDVRGIDCLQKNGMR